MDKYRTSENRCDVCTNSRAVVSENGIHYVCCLSKKRALDCLMGTKDYYDGYTDGGEKAEIMKGE